jgi:hypothetical protein
VFVCIAQIAEEFFEVVLMRVGVTVQAEEID